MLVICLSVRHLEKLFQQQVYNIAFCFFLLVFFRRSFCLSFFQKIYFATLIKTRVIFLLREVHRVVDLNCVSNIKCPIVYSKATNYATKRRVVNS
jgi:hypothetical protein